MELETLWVADDGGRLRHERTEQARPAPLLVVTSGAGGGCWAPSVRVPSATVARLAELLDTVGPSNGVGWRPDGADELIRILQDLEPAATPVGGPSYVVDAPPTVPLGLELLTSAEADVARLRGRMPEADQRLTAPWAAAMVDGRVAAVCETARTAPQSVEAGVWTYEPYRRQGLGAAVTAAWAALVTGRTAFYSTSWDNHASQGVARHLGLRPIGHWWQVVAGA